jgi:predicted ATPase
VLEAYSISHGKALAWLSVIELLRSYFDIQEHDEQPARREKISVKLEALDPALSETSLYLFGLLGIVEGPDTLAQMDPNIKRQRTLDAIKRIILSESRVQPLVLIFEDLHWIDNQTQALLDLLADSIATARVLLMVNYRPEYRHEWVNKSHYSQLRLESLAGDNAAAMLNALVGDSPELDPLRRMIIERTQGNPFFVEEMLQVLFDEGVLTRNGVVKIARPFSQLRLPRTFQGILAARIDRQPGEHKQLLQTLAVIGRESRLDLIEQIVPIAEPQLHRMLAELRASEFIYEQPAYPQVEFVFKHALTQEVAYNSVLIERRKQLHERIGGALETLYTNSLDDHLAELAHHYARANNAANAVRYLTLAGKQALERSAFSEAQAQLQLGLEWIKALAESPGP